MNRLVVFRADASPEIGSGHVVRCATLGAALKARGAEILFISLCLGEDYRRWLAGQGFIVVDPRADIGSQMSAKEDAAATIAALLRQAAPPHLLIVDHYGLSAEWERRLRPHVRHLAVIDDLADRPHDCDLLLDQNFYLDGAHRYDGLVPAGCRLLLGPKYALLRPQFAEARHILRQREGRIRQLLICFGGGDAEDLTSLAVEAFLDAHLDGINANVIVGAAYPHWDRLVARYGDRSCLTLERNVADMADRMMCSDLFLGSGGSMTWERAALGLPGITIAIADNQSRLCVDLAATGAGIHLGDGVSATIDIIRAALQESFCQPDWIAKASHWLQDICDGLGAERLCVALGELDGLQRS